MELSQELIDALVGPDVQLGTYREDKRASGRIPIAHRAQLSILGRDRKLSKRTSCQVREVSRTGVGIIINVALPEDSSFVLYLRQDKRQPICLECRVVRSENTGTGSRLYSVGATFVRHYSADAEQVLRNQDTVERVRKAILS
jgi:hypothetical protein